MNPLDYEEYREFINIGMKECPIHTDRTVQVRTHDLDVPKNFMDYSSSVFKKYIDNNLHIIEEIQYRNKNHYVPEWLKQYNQKYFIKYDTFAHDGFFKNHISPDLRDDRNIGKMLEGEFIQFGKILGTEINLGTDTGSTVNGDNGLLLAQKGIGTLNAYYNQIQGVISAANGSSWNLAVYDESSSLPHSLLASTGSIITVASTYHTITEFQADTANLWGAYVYNNAAMQELFDNSSSTVGKYVSVTYPTLPNPFGSPTNTNYRHMKIKHS